jgi:hypothetical protein
MALDPDLEQGGNTNVVVRRDLPPETPNRVLVHGWCPWTVPRSTSNTLVMLE